MAWRGARPLTTLHPVDDATQPAVQATLRLALERGFLSRAQLREALILQDQLEASGKPTPLLTVLTKRFLKPEHVPELSRRYKDELARQALTPAPAPAPPEPEEKELDVPADILTRSCELVLRPPELDSEKIKLALRESEKGLQRHLIAPGLAAAVPAPPPPPAGDDLEDRVFVSLARRAGYPTKDELRQCAEQQAERRRRGERPTLFSLACGRGLLDDRRRRRFLRWAEQIASQDQRPIEDEDEAAPVGPGDAVPRGSRVVHASAADFPVLALRCSVCGAEVEPMAVLEERARVEGATTFCGSCDSSRRPPDVKGSVKLGQPAPAPSPFDAKGSVRSVLPPAPTPEALQLLPTPPPAAPKKEGKAKKLGKAIRASAAFVVRGLVKPPPEGGTTPRAPKQVTTLALGAAGVAIVGLLLVVAVLLSGGGPSSGPQPPGPAPPATSAAADEAWTALRAAPPAEAAARLRAFARLHPADPRAADALLYAGALEAVAARPAEAPAPAGEPGPRALADGLAREAERLAADEPGAALRLCDVALRLVPTHPDATRVRGVVQARASAAAAEAAQDALALARQGAARDGLDRLVADAARWRGAGADDALAGSLDRLLAAALEAARTTTGRPEPDPATVAVPPPRTPPPPPRTPPPAPSLPAPAPEAPPAASATDAWSLYCEAAKRLAADDAAGLLELRGKLEKLAPQALETRAVRGFERFAAGRFAEAADELQQAQGLETSWVPWVLVRAAFFGGRYDQARQAAARLPGEEDRALWQMLIDGPLAAGAPLAHAACAALSPEKRYRVITDVGVDVAALEARLQKAKPEERDELVAKARRSHKALAEIGELMDKAARAYANLLSAEPREQVVPTVYVLSSEARFHLFSEQIRSGSTESTLGYYMPGYRILVFYEREPRREGGRALSAATQEVLLHETFHQWIRLHLDDPPTWFDEGFAEFFAFSEVGPQGLRYGLLPARYPSRLDNIRWAIAGRAEAAPPLPLDRLLRSGHEQFMVPPQTFTNYAHSWSFVHFLASSKGGQKALKDYFNALREGKGRDGAFDATFAKVDLAALDREWRQYVDKLK